MSSNDSKEDEVTDVSPNRGDYSKRAATS